MAFDDNPTVDPSSERSEESVLRIKSILTRKAGFISRDELPDYGVDLNVELVSNQGATSNIFPIQIKSAAEVTTIDHEGSTFVSIPFKTSRLGHLCRRSPSYGIIMVYDETSETSYFDYVEEIVTRLRLHRGNDDWKAQYEVNILVPLVTLRPDSAASIHQKMTLRFSDHSMLLNRFGSVYRIPTFTDATENSTIDFNDPGQVEKLLKEHGMDLFHNKDFDMITGLLGRIPSNVILSSKELILLAAITSSQTGMTIECDYYLQRSRQHSANYTEGEAFLLDYTTLMLEFKKGNLTSAKFSEGLSTLRQRSKNPHNTITLDINIIYAKFLEKDESQSKETLLATIHEVFPRIDQSNLAATDKMLLKLFNLENLHHYGTGLFLRDAGKFKIQEKLGLGIPMSERLVRVTAILEVLRTSTVKTHEILQKSIDSNDKIVIAFASYYKARFFFTTRFHTMMLKADDPQPSEESVQKLYENTLNFCYHSVSLFFGLGLLHEVHQSLCCAYDLQILHRVLYKSEVGSKTTQEILKTMREIEAATGIQQYNSIVEPVFNDLSSRKESTERPWADVPDDQVEKFARIALDAYEIPEERLVHIIADIYAHKAFYGACTNPDLELLQDLSHHRTKKTTYAAAPIFFIRSKKSGIQSKKSTNINLLLDQFSTILKRS